MIGPDADLKAAIFAAIPRNENDPKFYEKLCTVNEVLLEIMLLMQKNYKEEITSLKEDLANCRRARDAYSTQVEAYRKWESQISKG